MKRFMAILATSLAIFLFSCGNQSAKEEAQATDTTTEAVAEPVPAKPAFTPFKVVVVQHKVKNFEKSKEGYFRNDSLRQAYGISHFVIGRMLNDTNTVFVMDKIEDVEKSKSYFNQASVKTAAQKSGVGRAPGTSYAEIIRLNESPAATDDRLSISHHVKDFDTWLKVYDAEGESVRASHGLVDRGMARDLNDPNMVYLIFVVTDIKKAKARVASPELKKIMEDAGVDSPPTTRWFRQVD